MRSVRQGLCYGSTAIIHIYSFSVGIEFRHLKSVPARKWLICLISGFNHSSWKYNGCLDIKICEYLV